MTAPTMTLPTVEPGAATDDSLVYVGAGRLPGHLARHRPDPLP